MTTSSPAPITDRAIAAAIIADLDDATIADFARIATMRMMTRTASAATITALITDNAHDDDALRAIFIADLSADDDRIADLDDAIDSDLAACLIHNFIASRI